MDEDMMAASPLSASPPSRETLKNSSSESTLVPDTGKQEIENIEQTEESLETAQGKSPVGHRNRNENAIVENRQVETRQRFDWAEGKKGGIYIPPFKLERLQAERLAAAGGKLGGDYEGQRIAWELLKKKINGCVNKVNVDNLTDVIPEFFRLNLIRGKGLLTRAILKAQLTSPEFTNVYAALIAVINTKIPEIGENILSRVILQFRKAFRRNDKRLCLSTTKLVAHLVNQLVCHELVALQLLTLLLEQPTDDSVEVAVSFVKECGSILSELSPQGLYAVFERLRGILHEGEIDKRVQYMIEALFAIRRDGFSRHPPYPKELDLVEDEDRITHEIYLDDELEPDTSDDVFHYDPEYDENEAKYAEIRDEILGVGKEEDNSEEDEEEAETEEHNQDGDTMKEDSQTVIEQGTDMELIQFRRSVYLTIMSSLSFEEGAHNQERTYLRFYGLLARRFCALSKVYSDNFDELFGEYYATIHRLETSKLRNVAKFFAALLETDSISWSVMEYIRLVEEETTSSSRIFVKILFQELAENMTIERLRERLKDPYLQPHFQGIFPLDNPRNTRFAINYFTSIGLGVLTEEMREHLKNVSKTELVAKTTSQMDIAGDNEFFDVGTDEKSDHISNGSSAVDSESSSLSSPRPRRMGRKRRSTDNLSEASEPSPRSVASRHSRDRESDSESDSSAHRHHLRYSHSSRRRYIEEGSTRHRHSSPRSSHRHYHHHSKRHRSHHSRTDRHRK
eukprot:jgi/Galph1/5235/GphlegSOOS_G3880.1